MSDTEQVFSTEDFLAHYGVLGMKWGKRKSETRTPRISRKENRKLNAEASQQFYDRKAESIANEAVKKGDRVLVETRFQGDTYHTITTGKEFTKALVEGKAFDIRVTEIMARQPKKNAQFELNENRIGAYRTQDFRKANKRR